MDRFLNSFRLTGAYPRVLVWVSCCSSFTIPQCTSKVYRASPLCKVNWELKQWRQRRQRGRQKSNRFYYAKQQLCTCITLFCTFLYRPCTTTTWKCLIASFIEDVNKWRRISFSLSKLEGGPQEINSREIRLHLPFSANWNKRDKDWKNGNSFQNWRFRCRCLRRC